MVESAAEVCYQVGLDEERYRAVGGFSTGMQQRVKLAVALVHDPSFLLLDEPTDGMDPQGREDMLDLIARIRGELGIDVLVSTHLLGEVERVCDRVVMVHGGHVLTQGSIAEIAGTTEPGFGIRLGDNGPEVLAALRAAGLEVRPSGEELLVQGSSDLVRDVAAQRGLAAHDWSRVTALAAAFAAVLIGFSLTTYLQSQRIAEERDVAEAERSRALASQQRAEAVLQFMTDSFQLADPSHARGKDITAREILDQGAARIRTELSGQPELQATLLDTIGSVYLSLDLPGDPAALEPHPLANAERAGAEQHGAGDEVAEGLLRRETDDDRGERAADGERPRVEAGDAQRDDDRQTDEDQADEEPDRSRGAGIEATEEGRPQRSPDVAGDLPAEHDEHDRGDDLDRLVEVAPEQLVAVVVDDEDRHEQRDHHERLDPRTLDRAPAQLPCEPGLAPRVAARVEQLSHVISVAIAH